MRKKGVIIEIKIYKILIIKEKLRWVINQIDWVFFFWPSYKGIFVKSATRAWPRETRAFVSCSPRKRRSIWRVRFGFEKSFLKFHPLNPHPSTPLFRFSQSKKKVTSLLFHFHVLILFFSCLVSLNSTNCCLKGFNSVLFYLLCTLPLCEMYDAGCLFFWAFIGLRVELVSSGW